MTNKKGQKIIPNRFSEFTSRERGLIWEALELYRQKYTKELKHSLKHGMLRDIDYARDSKGRFLTVAGWPEATKIEEVSPLIAEFVRANIASKSDDEIVKKYDKKENRY